MVKRYKRVLRGMRGKEEEKENIRIAGKRGTLQRQRQLSGNSPPDSILPGSVPRACRPSATIFNNVRRSKA
jgi:hypothetical protein